MTQFPQNSHPPCQNLYLSTEFPLSHALALCRILRNDHQFLRHQFDIPLFCCASDSRNKEDLIGTVDAAQVDKTGRIDEMRFY